MFYYIIPYKKHKNYNKYLIGYDILNNFYVYCADFNISGAVFCGTGQEVVEKLLDERFIFDVKREITKNSKSIGFKNRVWKCRQYECQFGNPIGQSE